MLAFLVPAASAAQILPSDTTEMERAAIAADTLPRPVPSDDSTRLAEDREHRRSGERWLLRGRPELTGLPAGSEEETYLRYLQLLGAATPYPWSVRGFSGREIQAMLLPDSGSPESARDGGRSADRFTLTPASVSVWFNSAFPHGSNDGAVWAGRGATVALQAGFAFRAGPLSAVIAPVWFGSENRAFPLAPTGRGGRLVYADPIMAVYVDRPQRFGSAAFSRLDPGETTIALTIGPVAAGASSASESWGPMAEYPFILGNNAPGIPRLFAGTSRPLNIGIARAHARVIWGRLEQSRFSPVQGSKTYFSFDDPGRVRFATGMALTILPRGLTGLELGVSRFFHSVWPQEGLPPSYFRKAFDPYLKQSLPTDTALSDPSDPTDNQLLSLFARWAFPRSGFELYAEYGKEDHNWDVHDAINEPDHARSYGLGFRKVFRRDAGRVQGLRAELINFQMPTLARHRSQGGIYIHTLLRQGHTHRGQLLGADVGVGAAAGAMIAFDSYSPTGRTSWLLRRTLRQERGFVHVGGPIPEPAADVRYDAGFERTVIRGRTEFMTALTAVHNLNRNFQGDRFNLNANVTARFRF